MNDAKPVFTFGYKDSCGMYELNGNVYYVLHGERVTKEHFEKIAQLEKPDWACQKNKTMSCLVERG